MNCGVFRKRLNDLIEDNISYDLKDAMLKHIEDCEACKKLYEEEICIEKDFKLAFEVADNYFQRSRGDIMKSIDPNRYGKNPIKKIGFHLMKYKAIYSSCAALLVVAVFAIPFALNYFGSGSSGTQFSASSSGKENKSMTANYNEKSVSLSDNNSAANVKKNEKSSTFNKQSGFKAEGNIYTPTFEKVQLAKNANPKFNTPIVKSPDGKFQATVEGRGPEGIEEAEGKIYIKDLSTGESWNYSLTNNTKQYSPKQVAWLNDGNILVIVGNAQGTVSGNGGGLYVLNLQTAKAYTADPTNSIKLVEDGGKTEIIKVNSANEQNIQVQVKVYDDNLNNFTTETKTISFPFSEIKQYIEPNNQ